MADYQVQFVLMARDGATPVLQQEQRTLQQMASSTTRNASDHRRATDMMAEGNQRLSRANQDTEFSFGELDRKIQGLVTGFGAYFVVQKGLELVNLGEQVHDVSVQFDAYAESLDNTTELLPRLREATLGGASDMDLMASAAQLASLKLASTDDDLEKFIGLTYRLTGSTEQVGNLAMALTNMSYLRLDAFGLSADLARKRVAELKAEYAGIADTEAFTRAVIEQMEDKVGSFGGALEAQTTNLDRFKVEWTNFWNDLAETAAGAANDIIGYVESTGPQAFPTGGILTESVEDLDALRQQLSLLVDAMDIGVSMTVEEAIAQEKNLRGLTEEGRAILDQLVQAHAEFSALGTGQPTVASSSSLQAAMAVYHQNQERAYLTQTYTPQFNAFEREAELRAMQDQVEYSRQLYYNEQRRQEIMTSASGLIVGIADEYRTITDNATLLNDVPIVTPDQAERVQEMADEYAFIVERARVANENGLISDAELQRFENAAENSQRMASELQRGAEALDNMSKSDFFGTTSGGLMGQLGDEVIQAARDAGVSEQDLQEFETALNLESGRANEASLHWQNYTLPLLVETIRTNSADAAIASLLESIQAQGTAQFGPEAGAYLAGAEWVPTEEEIQPFDTAMTNIATNMDASVLSSEMLGMSLSGADFVAGKIVEKSGQIESHWNSLTSKIQKIQVEIDVTRLSGGPLETWLAGGITRVTRDSGGAVPGQDARLE
ncbi:MAG: hypothetical protein IT320_20890 [Anaerolineae bacterium]|nr:hypothetical protein [Anaerolineae bacterium]